MKHYRIFSENDRLFTCSDCGGEFLSLAPPAETRENDPNPQCSTCIEKGLDAMDAEPLSEEEIDRIMSKVVLDTEP